MKSFETVIVGRDLFQSLSCGFYRVPKSRRPVECISTKWPNVRSIILKCSFSDQIWVEKFGIHLSSIRQEGWGRWRFNPYPFPGWCHLHLRQVDFYGEVFRKTVGKSLEEVSVRSFLYNIPLIRLIKEHCRNITHLFFRWKEEEVCDEIFEGIDSFGVQLEHALVHNISETQLLRVMKGCSNSWFDLATCSISKSLKPALKILGDKLELPGSWNECPNIRELKLYGGFSHADASLLKEKPKYLLKRLELTTFYEKIDLIKECIHFSPKERVH